MSTLPPAANGPSVIGSCVVRVADQPLPRPPLAAPDSGHIGLARGFTDEIGPLLVRKLTVEGFVTGISTKCPVNSNVLERITLRGQRAWGWDNYHHIVFVRELHSENVVSGLRNQKNSWGTGTLVDTRIIGRSATENTPGILNQRQMYMRGVEVQATPSQWITPDKGRDNSDVKTAGVISEATSHQNISTMFRHEGLKTADETGTVTLLPVKRRRTLPGCSRTKIGRTLSRIVAIPQANSSASLQAAIDSGATTIYLPAGANFLFDSEVILRGAGRRIIGLEERFHTEGKAVWRFVDSEPADVPALIIERMSNTSGGQNISIQHDSKRPLTLSSDIGFHVEGHGAGDISSTTIAVASTSTRPARMRSAASSIPRTTAPCAATMVVGYGFSA